MRVNRNVLLGVVAFVLAAAGGPAFGAYPGFNGSLVYTSGSGDGPSIYGSLALVSPAGGRERFLRANPYVADTDASWSPDGSWIAYSRTNYGPGPTALGIWRIRADGSERQQLVTSGNSPTWSPNGSRIAYIGYSDGYGIYTMNADGTQQTKVSISGNLSPENLGWSPDGTQIAVSDYYGGIYVIEPTGGTPTQLVPAGKNPAWAPDSTKIAFSSFSGADSEIFVMNADGTEATPLTANAEDDDFPAWSPDGTKIAFETGTIEAYSALAVMNADGTEPTVITDDYYAHSDPDWQPLPMTLVAQKATISFGRSVLLSGRLFWLSTTNRTVSLYAIPYGGSKRLVKTLTLGDTAGFSASVRPQKRTTYITEWSGDGEHGAASRSVIVSVRARVKTWLSGYFAVSGRYKLYHFGQGVRQTGQVRPNHAGKRLYFFAQKHTNGRWRDVASESFRLGSNSTVRAVFGGGSRGAYRTRVVFLGDADHSRNSSPWVYFKLV